MFPYQQVHNAALGDDDNVLKLNIVVMTAQLWEHTKNIELYILKG